MRSGRAPAGRRLVVVQRGVSAGVIVAVVILAGGGYWVWSRARGQDPVRGLLSTDSGTPADAAPTAPVRTVEFDRFMNRTTIWWLVPMRPIRGATTPVAWVVGWNGTGDLQRVPATGGLLNTWVRGYSGVPSQRHERWLADGRRWDDVRPLGLTDYERDQVEGFSKATKVELQYEGAEYEMHPDGPRFLAEAARELGDAGEQR